MTSTTKSAGPGKALRTLRLGAGMTLEQVSAAAGVSISYLSRVETGTVTPTPTWFFTVATELGHRLSAQERAA